MTDIDALEQQLLSLGRAELQVLQDLDKLAHLGRDLAVSGRMEEAESVWSTHSAMSVKLQLLLQKIKAVEVELYTARRVLRRKGLL